LEPFVCDLCRKTFTSAQALDQHVTAAHPPRPDAEAQLTSGAEALPTGTQMSGQSGTTPPRGTGGAVTP